MVKSNIRSFRFDDEIAAIIEKYDGSNLNDKFNNLIRYCFIKLPEAKEQLKELENEIKVKKQELVKITDLAVQMNNMKSNLIYLNQNIMNIHREAKELYRKEKSK